MTIELASIRGFPLYDADLEARAFRQAVKDVMSAAVAAADALLIATPEYNFCSPVCSRMRSTGCRVRRSGKVLAGKPLAIAGAGGRLGSARAQYHLRQVCGTASACSQCRGPSCFVLNAWGGIRLSSGRLKDEMTVTQIGELLTALATWTLLLRNVSNNFPAQALLGDPLTE